MKNQWLEIDKEGLRKTLGQKDKVFLLTEMVSNAWDEDITQVEVSLTRPDENGFSWLRVTDNSPTGWADLSHSHFREDEIVPCHEWTPEMAYFARLVGVIGPRLIGKPVVVQYINDEDNHIEGCFSKGYRGNRSKKGFKRVMTVNLAYCDPANLLDGYSLLLHELAHDKVESNDHLHHEFYDTCE